MRIVIPGVSGGIARLVARQLAAEGHEVHGIDARPWSDPPAGVELHALDLRKRAAEEVFRRVRPDAVIHLATVSALSAGGEERDRINLGGTQAVFAHAVQYGARQLLFVGRHTYYGASPDAALYHTEAEPPQGLAGYPELADLVAADLYAGSALWRQPQLQTAVLRLVYTLGPSGQGTLATFLKGRRVPQVLGFDPLFHFLHEEDAASAICAALHGKLRGVFNVAGPHPLPLSVLAREAGRSSWPLPQGLLRRLIGRLGLPKLPVGALEHLKYPIVVDTQAFRDATRWNHRFDELQTIRAFAEQFPLR